MRMIDSVEERQLRSNDAEGLVLGFSWFEPLPKPEKDPENGLLIGVAVVGSLIAAGMLLGGYILAGLVILGGAGLIVFSMFERQPEVPKETANGLTFRTDGQIMTIDTSAAEYKKDGTINVKWRSLKRTVDEILNISMQPMKANDGSHYKHDRDRSDPAAGYFAHLVVVDFTSGERFHAGQFFPEADARIAVIQLNKALEEIRAERERLVQQ